MKDRSNQRCKDCDKRFPGCHDTCESYQAWKKKHDEESAKVKEKKRLENLFWR